MCDHECISQPQVDRVWIQVWQQSLGQTVNCPHQLSTLSKIKCCLVHGNARRLIVGIECGVLPHDFPRELFHLIQRPAIVRSCGKFLDCFQHQRVRPSGHGLEAFGADHYSREFVDRVSDFRHAHQAIVQAQNVYGLL